MQPMQSKYPTASVRDWRKNEWDFENSPLLELTLKHEFVGYVKEAFYTDGKLVLSDTDRLNMTKMFYWMTTKNEPANVAPFLTGTWGTGKSVTMKGIIKFIDKHYPEISTMYILAQDLAEAFKDYDSVTINRMKTVTILAIDDVGKEAKTVQYFGNEEHPFHNIIMHRYDKRKPTMLTSNDNLEALGKIYGWEIYDRLRQATFEIKCEGKSRRK